MHAQNISHPSSSVENSAIQAVKKEAARMVKAIERHYKVSAKLADALEIIAESKEQQNWRTYRAYLETVPGPSTKRDGIDVLNTLLADADHKTLMRFFDKQIRGKTSDNSTYFHNRFIAFIDGLLRVLLYARDTSKIVINTHILEQASSLPHVELIVFNGCLSTQDQPLSGIPQNFPVPASVSSRLVAHIISLTGSAAASPSLQPWGSSGTILG